MHIDITQLHTLPIQKARLAAEEAGKKLSREFGLKYRWYDNEEIHFERPGVKGYLELSHDNVRIVIKLGILLLPLKAQIEKEIAHNLDKLFRDRQGSSLY